jgi:hypothetical protein
MTDVPQAGQARQAISGGHAVSTQAVFPGWPGGAQVAVALTFDVDGEAPWLGEGPLIQNGCQRGLRARWSRSGRP